MMKNGKFKSFLMNQWTIAIGSGIVLILITSMITAIAKAESIKDFSF
jgi:hypothetical protein